MPGIYHPGKDDDAPLELTGRGLTVEAIVGVARQGIPVALHSDAIARIESGRAVVERYLEEGREAYGLTTGLGARVGIRVSEADLGAVSLQTIRGRANAVGPRLPADVVRAAMLIRANGIAAGGSGARSAVAEALVALLNARVEPVVPGIGSTGAGDLCVLAHIGLALIGEGKAQLDGIVHPASEALERAGLDPLELAPKDGLALINATAASAACAALALQDARETLEEAQIAAALSFEGFRANLTPIDERVAAARPAPGQISAAAGLRALLAGGALTRPGAARRLQDPLSFRCVSQVHGSLVAALDLLAAALEPELNGAGDNPLVLVESEEMEKAELVSTGNFHTPALALAADAVALGLAQVGNLAAARSARLLSEPLTGLRANLADPESSGAGLAPLLKVADALAAELVHAAAPTCLARTGTDAVEDDSTGSLLGAQRLTTMLERLRLLVALQLVVAARAVELAQPEPLGHGTSAAFEVVRELAEPLGADRPLGRDVERIAGAGLRSGRLRAAVREACARAGVGSRSA
jgi:histidine ammonia-lyase